MRRLSHIITLLLLSGLLSACVQYENKRGVDVNWHAAMEGKIVRGETRREDVLALLGPPSQLIALDRESVLYYLFEHSEGEGIILILYNRMRIGTRYDRAVFFFDENELLTDFSTYIYQDDEA